MDALTACRTWLVFGALVVMVLALVVAVTLQPATRAWREARPFSRFVFLVGVLGIALYGGSKGTISFPYTDIETRYLVDAGSYVTNNAIRIYYTVKAGVPNSAPLFIDYREVCYTNDEEWTTLKEATVGDYRTPHTVEFVNATNYNWLVYTTWTPGSAVETNGVWHAYWGLDRKAHAELIPVRSCIRVNSEVIATPESKRKWEEAQDAD